jgi:hypothetical protein
MTKALNQASWTSGQNLNSGRCAYEAGELPIPLRRFGGPVVRNMSKRVQNIRPIKICCKEPLVMRDCYFKQGNKTESIHMVIYVCSLSLYPVPEIIVTIWGGVWFIRRILDGMIGFIAPYTFTQLGTTSNYSATVFYTFQFTVPHAQGFSVFTSRILATDLSQSHCNFKSHMKSSLHSLIPFLQFPLSHLRLPIPKTRLEYSGLLFYTPSTLSLLLLSCRTLPITTLYVPHWKHRLLLSRMRVNWSFT